MSAVKFGVDYPAEMSRGDLLLKTFLGFFYIGIPHGFMLFFRMIAVSFINMIAWWAILITGKYPENMFHFVVKTIRWAMRVNCYMANLTDEKPPFHGEE